MVFQSVSFSSNRQNVFPPLEIVVHGLSVPGTWATRQPVGKGTRQFCVASPFAIPKLQDCSVVASESSMGCAWASSIRLHRPMNMSSRTNQRFIRRHPSTAMFIGVNHDSTHVQLRENSVGMPEIHWLSHLGQQEKIPQDAQKGRSARPQASRNRRRTLRGTLRISMSRERRWRPFSAS